MLSENMTRVLVLDDDHCRVKRMFERMARPGIQFVWVNHPDDAVALLTEQHFDTLHLDHDIHLSDCGTCVDPEKIAGPQGMCVVDWLVEVADTKEMPALDRIVIHSWNESKALVMRKRLRRAGYTVSYEPFKFGDLVLSDGTKVISRTTEADASVRTTASAAEIVATEEEEK